MKYLTIIFIMILAFVALIISLPMTILIMAIQQAKHNSDAMDEFLSNKSD